MKIDKKWKELSGLESTYMIIPYSVIVNEDIEDNEIDRKCVIKDKRRVATLIYLYFKTAMDNEINFSIRMIVDWLGKKPNRHTNNNTVGGGIVKCVNEFKKMDWFECPNEISYGKVMKAKLDREKYKECFLEERFAKVYVDEVLKILSYTPSGNDHRLDNTSLLLVFAYLRMMIPVRNNLAGSGYRIEAYDSFYKNIGLKIGLSERAVSKSIEILVDLGLIYEKRRNKKIKRKDDKKRYFNYTYIFCNTYKRLKGGNGKIYLAECGEDYYIKEADDKERDLEKKGY